MPPPPKTCVSCGRAITWRKAWERDWEQVRYCSAGCRRRGVSDAGEHLQAELIRLAGASSRGVTDVAAARAVAGDGWREQLEPVRRAARRLVADGRAELRQGGRVVDPSRARGEVTVRLLS